MITPIEIRQQTFKKVLRGYDKDEVEAFLLALSQEWEQQTEAFRSMKAELDKVKASYDTLKEVEAMLHKTLHQAEQSSRDMMENARQKADLKIREAEVKADEIIRKGKDDLRHMKQDISELGQRREQLMIQMQVFLKTHLEQLETYGFPELPAPSTFNGHLNGQVNSPKPIPPTQQPPVEKTTEGIFSSQKNGSYNDHLMEDIMKEL